MNNKLKKSVITSVALIMTLSVYGCENSNNSQTNNNVTDLSSSVETTELTTEIPIEATTEANPIDSLNEKEKLIYDSFMIGVCEFSNPTEFRLMDIGMTYFFDSSSPVMVEIKLKTPDKFETSLNFELCKC